jgi:hypothetical protein
MPFCNENVASATQPCHETPRAISRVCVYSPRARVMQGWATGLGCVHTYSDTCIRAPHTHQRAHESYAASRGATPVGRLGVEPEPGVPRATASVMIVQPCSSEFDPYDSDDDPCGSYGDSGLPSPEEWWERAGRWFR